jgi:transaldolase/glucose-6-phosphate isomerase
MGHYESVANAYLRGLAACDAAGGELARVASVASFFVSRVDTSVDHQLDKIGGAQANALLGRTAIANSKVVYQRYKTLFGTTEFVELQNRGARSQRLLWASTSTKNPSYRDTMYVDELIGPDTVNTMPPSTIDAFRDHGQAKQTLENDLEDARSVLAEVAALGIDLDEITGQLQHAGIKAFADAYDELMQKLAAKLANIAAAT